MKIEQNLPMHTSGAARRTLRQKRSSSAPNVLLKTDLSSLRVSRGVSDDDDSYYLKAVYWRGCPIHCDRFSEPLPGYCDLSTYILSPPIVRPWEPGVYYRLPQVAWEAVGSREPLSLIPLDVAIEHSPSDGRVHTSHLSYGAHTVCGLFPTETAAKWAALPPEKWFSLYLLGFERSTGLHRGWLDALTHGAVHLSYSEPLLPRAVEVYRETV